MSQHVRDKTVIIIPLTSRLLKMIPLLFSQTKCHKNANIWGVNLLFLHLDWRFKSNSKQTGRKIPFSAIATYLPTVHNAGQPQFNLKFWKCVQLW